MLKTKVHSISVNATIKIGEEDVVTLYRTLNSDGSYGSSTQHIDNPELYTSNIDECRIDREKFEAQCLEIQDQLIMGTLIDLASLEL